jgi:hypothetical protein
MAVRPKRWSEGVFVCEAQLPAAEGIVGWMRRWGLGRWAAILLTALALAVPTLAAAAQPPNDDFANPTVLPSEGGAEASNIDATLEPGEPQHGAVPGGASVWFAWTAARSGAADLFISPGAGYWLPAGGPQVAVYTGSTLNALTRVAAIEWWRLGFPTVAGTTYRIAVAGRLEGSGEPEMRNFEIGIFMRGTAEATPPHARIRSRHVNHRKNSVIFSFDATEPDASFRCSLDRFAFSPCRSPKRYTQLRPGMHVFSVAAVSPSGVFDTSPSVAHFKIPRSH